ncbi:hypothetical protein CUMW_084100 [Citrus unshiu]|nr:hypothetical protein CUMW_084100 [Citrus unshiu]
MALRGTWQLQKLIVGFCDWGGSSRGIRAFMESHLPAFKASNPQLEVVTELIRGQHPHLKGLYKFDPRRDTPACHKAKKRIGKKGCKIEDKTPNEIV